MEATPTVRMKCIWSVLPVSLEEDRGATSGCLLVRLETQTKQGTCDLSLAGELCRQHSGSWALRTLWSQSARGLAGLASSGLRAPLCVCQEGNSVSLTVGTCGEEKKTSENRGKWKQVDGFHVFPPTNQEWVRIGCKKSYYIITRLELPVVSLPLDDRIVPATLRHTDTEVDLWSWVWTSTCSFLLVLHLFRTNRMNHYENV